MQALFRGIIDSNLIYNKNMKKIKLLVFGLIIFFVLGFSKNMVRAQMGPDFGSIDASLTASGIENNLSACASTPTACINLYFEKLFIKEKH